MSYKLNFKTTGQDVTAPNLFTPYSEWIPCRSFDHRQHAFYTAEKSGADLSGNIFDNSNTIETQTIDNTAISARRVIDDIVYSQLQEPHSIRPR